MSFSVAKRETIVLMENKKRKTKEGEHDWLTLNKRAKGNELGGDA